MEPCLIVVARDRLDLLEAFASRYGQEGEVEIRLDQRQARPWRGRGERADRRAPRRLAPDFQGRGFLVIPRAEAGYLGYVPLGVAADVRPAPRCRNPVKGVTMSVPPKGLCPPSTRPPARGLLIVARDQPDLYDCLRHAYGESETLTVFLDRRQGERRRSRVPIVGERRHERRRPLSITKDLRYQQYVLVRPHYRRPRD